MATVSEIAGLCLGRRHPAKVADDVMPMP